MVGKRAFTIAQSQPGLIIPTQAPPGSAPRRRPADAARATPASTRPGSPSTSSCPSSTSNQADEWALNGDTARGWAWVGGTWIATGLGWAFVALFVAGYTGLVRSD
jgi:hypothetical protein